MEGKRYTPLLSRSQLFKGFSEKEIDEIYDEIMPHARTYAEDEILYFEGDEVRRFSVLFSGSVRAEKVYEEGSVHILNVFYPGETFCIEEAASLTGASPVNYVAAGGPATVVSIELRRLMNTRFGDRFNQNLIYSLADDCIRRLYKTEMLAIRGLRERIMTYFERMYTKTGMKTFGINMDRERFAQYLCVNRSALSNELSRMKQDGLIDYRKGTFTLLTKD